MAVFPIFYRSSRFLAFHITERYLRWLGNGAVSAHESTKADWKNQARPKGVRPAIANNRLAVRAL
jgi:hypothetical protein